MSLRHPLPGKKTVHVLFHSLFQRVYISHETLGNGLPSVESRHAASINPLPATN